MPESVTDSNGDTVWRGVSSAWGRSLRESAPVSRDVPQNLRFQGQYLDRETSLHYNTSATITRQAGVTPRWTRRAAWWIKPILICAQSNKLDRPAGISRGMG
ncbi:RHS domain-containing protein [Kosakonia sp. SMBL-WEM22]|uniref:RHS domain-containing protein n=1 Tax=Kosakonia sp. SMBL-WEM22 TaxID=2725560 RepID=UPI0031F967F1